MTWASILPYISLAANGLLGLTIGALFVFSRVLTIGQHRAIIKAHDKAHDKLVEQMAKAHAEAFKELAAHHLEVFAEKEARLVEMAKSRDYYREARIDEQRQRIKLGDQLIEGYDQYGKLATDLLKAIDETSKK